MKSIVIARRKSVINLSSIFQVLADRIKFTGVKIQVKFNKSLDMNRSKRKRNFMDEMHAIICEIDSL